MSTVRRASILEPTAGRVLTVPGDAPDSTRVVRELQAALERVGVRDLTELELAGRLIRPRLALAVLEREGKAIDPILAARFWHGALSVQLAHEASLVHDDIIDGSARRRGGPSHLALRGERDALLWGDRVLTSAYRAAVATSCDRWIRRFTRAVDRTVEGEREQRRQRGVAISREEYERHVRDKTGQLLGAALALSVDLQVEDAAASEASSLESRAEALHELGVELGLIYQMVDDLLDYCPHVDRGKPTFADHADRRWTWVLEHVPAGLDVSAEEIERALRQSNGSGTSPLDRLVAELQSRMGRWRARARALLGDTSLIDPLLSEWSALLDKAADGPEVVGRIVPRVPITVPEQAQTRPGRALLSRIPADWQRHIARHSRSFRFASRLAPARVRERIATVYAFCRVTDDLVDGAVAPAGADWRPADTVAGADDDDDVVRTTVSPGQAATLLDEWIALARNAYDGFGVGIPLLDAAMTDAARSGVPFRYVTDLADGMRMDLRSCRYADIAALRGYTYRVASVVGQWLTRSFGVQDPWVLERAAELGHAMQLTNILRDVGEDMERGRVYLPTSVLDRHGIDLASVATRARRGLPLPREWVSALGSVMSEAQASYDMAWQAIPALPTFFGRSVAVAAEVYRGIHDAIRANDYDVFTRRAHTSAARKAVLAAGAWTRLRRETRRWARHPSGSEHVVLVDADGNPVGRAEKLHAHRVGMLHAAFSIFVFDDRGRLLLQRRAANKYHSAGLWSNTACGHPRPGESVRDAARRRLREEMGIRCELTQVLQFRYRRPVGDGLIEHELDHVLSGRWHGTPDPAPEEVDGWEWVTPAAALEDAHKHPARYTQWFAPALSRLLGARPELRMGHDHNGRIRSPGSAAPSRPFGPASNGKREHAGQHVAARDDPRAYQP